MNLRSRITLGLLALSLLGVEPAVAIPSLTTSPTSVTTMLDLDGTGNSFTHIVKVADISASTDNAQGFTLVINSGTLSKPGGTAIPFQVTTGAIKSGSYPWYA